MCHLLRTKCSSQCVWVDEKKKEEKNPVKPINCKRERHVSLVIKIQELIHNQCMVFTYK